MSPALPLRIETLSGNAIIPHLPALARLRIEIFRDFPYLYQGDAAYEHDYVRSYAASPRAAIIVALAGDATVGVSTCLPLADEAAAVQAPFIAQDLPVARYFYFGESVLRHEYRNRGIGVAFFKAREAHAASFGDYRHTVFCAVQRPADHPLRPAGYVPLDEFWRKRGYTKQAALSCSMHWRDLGEPGETAKTLVFWTKALA